MLGPKSLFNDLSLSSLDRRDDEDSITADKDMLQDVLNDIAVDANVRNDARKLLLRVELL
jgi:hypothetical protein